MIIQPFSSDDIERTKRLFHLSVAEDNLLGLVTSSRYEVAYSAYLKEELTAVLIGWCGTIEGADLSILSELVRHQLYYSATHHIHTLTGEFDTTDPYATEVLKRFPFTPCPALITYQKKDVPLKVFE